MCPVCGYQPAGKFVFREGSEIQECPECNGIVYLTDCLRLHEVITDFGDCTSAITRFMNAVEHLIMANFIRMLDHYQPNTLSEMAFVIDGPLAIFGEPHAISFKLTSLYHGVSEKLVKKGLKPPIIMGLQKNGQVMEHAAALEPYLAENTFRIVDDDYRNRYISPVVSNSFGWDTYFGQDFIFKPGKKSIFSLALPYPCYTKSNTLEFARFKGNLENYKDQLPRALDLIRHVQYDLYQNAIIPIALAHRHSSISLVPGGKVLEMVTRLGLGKQQTG
jgi:hypothetical protein